LFFLAGLAASVPALAAAITTAAREILRTKKTLDQKALKER